eukprot:UN24580
MFLSILKLQKINSCGLRTLILANKCIIFSTFLSLQKDELNNFRACLNLQKNPINVF